MTTPISSPLAVLGAGSWGTALAILMARNGHEVLLWSHQAEHAEAINRDGRNEQYLPGIELPKNLVATSDLTDLMSRCQDLLIVVPSHAFRETLVKIRPMLKGHRVAWGTKGLEPDSCKLPHQQLREEMGDIPMAAISGPTFAKEVATGLPGAVTVASNKSDFALAWARALSNDHFRAYTSEDLAGVELGGACKNVIAIAAGIADGMGYGANTRAALIARALHEITRLGLSMGAQPETFTGLTGLGDLVLTCTDNQSRNRRTGLALGEGKDLQTTIKEIGQVVEGVTTAREIHSLAQKMAVEMPISEQVFKVLYEYVHPAEAVRTLMERGIKAETE